VFRRLPDLGRKSAEISEPCTLLPGFGEPNVARTIARLLPDDSVLSVGNSLPVRDLDAFAEPRACGVRVLHQRGLSGIDGLIAGAVGARSALPSDVVLTAVLGDVSAFHDLGSLSLLADVDAPLVLCVIDNGGGRIFGELPIAKAIPEASLERLFLTPPGPALPAITRAFGIETRVVETLDQLEHALRAGFVASKPHVLVVRVNAQASTHERRTFRDPGTTEKRA
jgi:2-succinyl-5-enolpyruvyl-6-hydroxy-3-cyclohexene-1-carboxylate synthase